MRGKQAYCKPNPRRLPTFLQAKALSTRLGTITIVNWLPKTLAFLIEIIISYLGYGGLQSPPHSIATNVSVH